MDPGAGFCVDADVAEICREGRDPVPPVAEPGQVERFGIQRSPAAGSSAGQFWLVIGEAFGDLELQLAVRLDVIQHLRAGPDKRLHQLVVHEPE